MTVLLLVENEDKGYIYTLILKVAFRAIETNPRFAFMQMLVLEPGGNSISFEQTGTYFYSIDIKSMKSSFIGVYFDYLSLRGHMGKSCTYGGLYIVNYYTSYTSYVGGICSHKTAARVQRLYGRHGLVLSDHVMIYIKQYNLLFLARVKLRFSLHQCLGLFNVHMHSKTSGKYFLDTKKQFELFRENLFYGHGTNFYYRSYGVLQYLGIKRNYDTSCFTLQNLNFDTMDNVNPMAITNKVIVGTGHVENVKPSRIAMAFWASDEELKHFDNCFADAFRFFPNNQNNEPYVFLKMPEEASWITHASAAKFALDMGCLAFGGAFHIHVQEADNYSQCFSEVGNYLYDVKHPIMPQGVCGGILVKLYQWGRFTWSHVSFQRPLLHARCCHLDMLAMPSSIPCIKRAYAYRARNWIKRIFDTHYWKNQINTSEVFTWKALCTRNNNYELYTNDSFINTCLDFFLEELITCDVKIHYRMSLLPLVNNTTVTESNSIQQICYRDTCYAIPRNVSTISWDDAQTLCQQMNGSLVSMNSDAEWRQLMTHSLFLEAIMFTKLFYIGYRTVSNSFHKKDHFHGSMAFCALLILWLYGLACFL